MFISEEGNLYQKACHLQGDIKAAYGTPVNGSFPSFVIPSTPRVKPSDKATGAKATSHSYGSLKVFIRHSPQN